MRYNIAKSKLHSFVMRLILTVFRCRPAMSASHRAVVRARDSFQPEHIPPDNRRIDAAPRGGGSSVRAAATYAIRYASIGTRTRTSRRIRARAAVRRGGSIRIVAWVGGRADESMERLRSVGGHLLPGATAPLNIAVESSVTDPRTGQNKFLGRNSRPAGDGERHERLHAQFLANGGQPVADEVDFEFPERGLFIGDYSQLPSLTTDIERAKADLDVYGYCLLANAMSDDKRKVIADALMASGAEDSMFNKGKAFTEVYDHPWVRELGSHVIGERYHAQIFVAPIHKEGFGARPLHVDTWWMPPPQRKSAPPRLRVGSVSRTNASSEAWHNESPNWITPSVRCPFIWMISDFTYSNGATFIVPGSHRSGRHPTSDEARNSGVHIGAIPLLGPAGTLCCYDGRLWHQAGENKGACLDHATGTLNRIALFAQISAPIMRQQENITLTTDDTVVATASPSLKRILGLEPWHGIGHVDGRAPLERHRGIGYMTSSGLPATTALVGTKEQPGKHGRVFSVDVPKANITLNTGDMNQLRKDLDEFGFAVLAAALTPAATQQLSIRAIDQAKAEAEVGVAAPGADGRQEIRTCLNKGVEFVELLLEKRAQHLVEHILGEEFLLSSATTSVPVAPTSGEEQLGVTQWWCPQPVHASHTFSDHTILPGDVSPALASSDGWAAASTEFIAAPVAATVIWACGGASGATATVVPRSHLSGRVPPLADVGHDHGAVEISLSPGSALVLDGRTWFAESHTRGLTVRYSYCGPQFRTEENHVLAMTDEALDAMPPEAKALLGFRTWFGYGGTFGRQGPGITVGSRALAVGKS